LIGAERLVVERFDISRGVAPHPRMPQVVQRAIPDGAEQVRAKGQAGVNEIPSPPELHHDILRDLFGGVEVPQDRRGDPNERGIPAPKCRVVCSFVTGLDAPQELGVFHKRAK
jgi:hypothetical protein